MAKFQPGVLNPFVTVICGCLLYPSTANSGLVWYITWSVISVVNCPGLSLIECYKTINSLNGLDPSAFFTFANDFRPLRANHRFKLNLASATLNSFKQSFFIRITDRWNNLPKEIAEVENLNIFKNRLKRHFIDFSSVY